ncbi:hypothetical protein Mgra_00005671 [Meloidogyne graminicola]|uniref:Uncharacterized protein n=1 Tax=Meloidogyne graminicola TaxID=189291 RepID=A0A8S9ZN52_9BILA|nr:hypothetical protein Mgra_00005671 [Meloidogyne graminicola]
MPIFALFFRLKMGNCLNKDPIEKQLIDDFKEQKKTLKLLLLGAAASGKSTMLKQMQILHTNSFNSIEERAKWKLSVYSSFVLAVERLLQISSNLIDRWELTETETSISELKHCLTYSEPFELPKFISALKQFWTDPAVHKQLLPNCEQFHLQESLPHFFNSLDRISSPNYVPTVQDILLLRIPTSGIVEVHFNVNRFPFRVFDVGGQRNERRKWIHCFDNVQAIIFITAISEFDQQLEEDESTNRLIESMNLFRSVCMAKWFINTGMILFLNKTDLFEQKIAGKKNIRVLFPHYTGSNSCSDQLDFIQQKFLSMNSNPCKQIYVHRTCATNTDQMELVLKNVFELVLASIYNRASMY